MARFVAVAFASTLFATSVQAQVVANGAQSPWHVSQGERAAPNFDIADDSADPGNSDGNGSVIVAGTDLTPNTVVGFGMFGERAERPDHARSTNRDYLMPKSRKAAVGFALRF